MIEIKNRSGVVQFTIECSLSSADLSGAYLGGLALIDGGLRSDGYRFFFTSLENEGPRIKAGCRNFSSFAEARAYWKKSRGGTALGDETQCILDHLERMAVGRRLIPMPAERVAA